MNAKLIIFDLDGTLVNAYPAINASLNYVLGQLGLPRQKAAVIRRAVGWGDESLLKPFVRRQDLKRALFLYRRHHKHALVGKARLFPGVIQLLRILRLKGYKLAIASNRPTKFSRILLRHLNLERYFDYVLCADKLKHGKPHPEILKKIIAKFSLLPRQALYVGDMVIDAQAARRARISCIIVTTGSSLDAEIKKEQPYRIIHSIRQLLRML